MSKEFRLEVGAQGLSTLIEVLATDTSNSDIPLKLNQAILGVYITDVSRSNSILLKKKNFERKTFRLERPQRP